MKQPIYKEIIFEKVDYEYVIEIMNKNPIGRVPLYALTNHFTQEDLELLLNNIKMILIDQKIHPRFPYPFYIVTNKDLEDTFIPIIAEKSQLPAFFTHKLKRLRKKETQTLQKSQILVEKINNLNIPHKHRELLDQIKNSKKLHKKTREYYFYQKIYQNLQLNS